MIKNDDDDHKVDICAASKNQQKNVKNGLTERDANTEFTAH